MKIMYSELIGVKSGISSERFNNVSNFQSSTKTIERLGNNKSLSGKSWTSAVNHFKAYEEINSAMFNIYYEMGNSLEIYLSDFLNQVEKTDEILDTDKLESLYRELQTAQSEYASLMSALADAMKDVPLLGEFFKKESIEPIREEIEILQKYRSFEASHSSQYSELSSLI